MYRGETLRHLRGSCRRRRRHRFQLLPGGVRAASVHPHQEISTGHLRRRHRYQQTTRGHPAAALLHRSDRAVQSIRDAQHPIRLGHRGHPRMTGQPEIGPPDPHPTTGPTATLCTLRGRKLR